MLRCQMWYKLVPVWHLSLIQKLYYWCHCRTYGRFYSFSWCSFLAWAHNSAALKQFAQQLLINGRIYVDNIGRFVTQNRPYQNHFFFQLRLICQWRRFFLFSLALCAYKGEKSIFAFLTLFLLIFSPVFVKWIGNSRHLYRLFYCWFTDGL